MFIRIIRDTVANKRPVFAGDLLEVGEDEGRYLIGIQKAVRVEYNPQAAPKIETAERVVPNVESTERKPKK